MNSRQLMSPILADIHARLDVAKRQNKNRKRPFVTLSYAQSLDGSIAAAGRRPIHLSGESSLTLTHELRAAHDAILVGIGTVLTDNPRLNVRLVPGKDPQPIVVDSHLRAPASCHLLQNGRGTWLAATSSARDEDEEQARARGAVVLRVASLDNGWVDLEALMASVHERGLDHLLVEGGARILSSFLESRLADYVVITMAPKFIGGMPALCESALSTFPHLKSWQSERVGEDLVLAGELAWSDP